MVVTSVIPAIQEAKVGEPQSEANSGKNASPCMKNIKSKKD
jgi:hypothetical protein